MVAKILFVLRLLSTCVHIEVTRQLVRISTPTRARWSVELTSVQFENVENGEEKVSKYFLLVLSFVKTFRRWEWDLGLAKISKNSQNFFSRSAQQTFWNWMLRNIYSHSTALSFLLFQIQNVPTENARRFFRENVILNGNTVHVSEWNTARSLVE